MGRHRLGEWGSVTNFDLDQCHTFEPRITYSHLFELAIQQVENNRIEPAPNAPDGFNEPVQRHGPCHYLAAYLTDDWYIASPVHVFSSPSNQMGDEQGARDRLEMITHD